MEAGSVDIADIAVDAARALLEAEVDWTVLEMNRNVIAKAEVVVG